MSPRGPKGELISDRYRIEDRLGSGGMSSVFRATDTILERTVAMDEGNFDMQVAWEAPAHHENPFQLVKSVEFKGLNVNACANRPHSVS